MGLLSSQIDTKAMVPVCRQLATTYEAGIPILRAFQHVGRESRDPKVKRVCGSIAMDLQSGATLSDAVRKQSAREKTARSSIAPIAGALTSPGEDSRGVTAAPAAVRDTP